MDDAEGVFCVDPPGIETPVHRFDEGDYGLADIPELMLVGQTAPDPNGRERIVLNARELDELKTFAHAYSFDFEEGLITLCLDLHRFASTRAESKFTFVAALLNHE